MGRRLGEWVLLLGMCVVAGGFLAVLHHAHGG